MPSTRSQASISAAKTGLNGFAAGAPAPSLPSAKRTRRQDQSQGQSVGKISPASSKKRKREDEYAGPDSEFISETIRQVKKAKVPKTTARADDLEGMQRLLPKLKAPRRQRTVTTAAQASQPGGDATEAYEMSSQEAKRLFRSITRIEAPIFISNGAPEILDEHSNLRPMKQILEWLQDPDESHHFEDTEEPRVNEDRTRDITVAEIKERFIEDKGYRQYPWNFPDIWFPMPAPDVPGFLRHPSCNLLNDIIRHIQTVGVDNLCTEKCEHFDVTAESCPKHYQTAEEVVNVRHAIRHWLGTIMLAEAGAYTSEHFDTPGFGTFISCYEGEIGFAYQIKNPDPPQKDQKKSTAANNPFLYKILRPGNCVYMPPGIVHFVLRQPHGTQTLATSIRIVRYCDIVEWLKTLSLELKGDRDTPENAIYFSALVRALTGGARHLLESAKKQKNEDKFGGAQTVKDADEWLGKIEKQLVYLLEQARNDSEK